MSDARAPQGEDDEYSATVLGSHWISGPLKDPAITELLEIPGEDATQQLEIPEIPGEDLTRRLETSEEDDTRRLETVDEDGTRRLDSPGEDLTEPLEAPAEDDTRRLDPPAEDVTQPLESSGDDATRRLGAPVAAVAVGAGAAVAVAAGAAVAAGEAAASPSGAPAVAMTKRLETTGGAQPDRVEGSLLRFGPGVTAALPLPFPLHPEPLPPRRRSEWRRYTLAAVILLAVLAYLCWQRYGPALEVREVAVTAGSEGPGCDATADVVAVVRTNGRAGTITYRWLRSDGTRSEQLTERVPSGRDEARLHLLWTFQGAGTYPAKAELQLISPTQQTAAAEFTYRCP
ncbi:hypothetical protein ACWGDE_21265 [Streptomyces sp. NPDC054956]